MKDDPTITDDTPLRLAVAAETTFPGGGMTARGLRKEDDKRRKSVTRVYVKPSAPVLKARELAKHALKRDAFDRWAERLRE
jgi:hypothetical protein